MRFLVQMMTQPLAALGAGVRGAGEMVRAAQRAAGQSVDRLASRAFHTLGRGAEDEVILMHDPEYTDPGQPGSAVPAAPDQPPAEGQSAPWSPIPPPCPAGKDSFSYRREAVEALLEKAAYFLLFSRDDPDRPDAPVFDPGTRDRMVGLDLHKRMHRADVVMHPTTPDTGPESCLTYQRSDFDCEPCELQTPCRPERAQGRLSVSQAMGEFSARLQAQFRIAPEGFVGGFGHVPPATPLDASRAQRFVVSNGAMLFDDRAGSGFTGFSTGGRTYPATEAGQALLRFGEVIHVHQSCGRFKDRKSYGVVTGTLTPPGAIQAFFVLRMADPSGELLTDASLLPLRPEPVPDAGATVLTFRGQVDPDHPPAPSGGTFALQVQEILRLARVSFDLGPSRAAVRTRTRVSEIAARLRYTISFRGSNTAGPRLFTMRDVLFSFCDRFGHSLGTLPLPAIEGSAELMSLPGAPGPVLQLAGFGPFAGGTGQFTGREGMVLVNGALSIYPAAISNLYVFRVLDPDGGLRGEWGASC
jgi:hypothetical protein